MRGPQNPGAWFQHVPMYMSDRGGGGREPRQEFTWFWKRRKYVV